ncbi:hypothetical protein F0562_034710 [Nyssa sinensis]|uniref:Malectin-like domain-containing protein n=1 Tax=Nyssa sinensis TaxID=561372 RepID=A0A5J5A947_9ASTE|nr:hypothetical protein F0562_034710 [Nyssa sinensis]
MPFLSLFFLLYLLTLACSQAPQPLRGVFIDCGATVPSVIEGREWIPDAGFSLCWDPKKPNNSQPRPNSIHRPIISPPRLTFTGNSAMSFVCFALGST